jgi:hypothetical protein
LIARSNPHQTILALRKEHRRMAIKLSLGLTKKLGLPAYSSVGASCHLECEVDSSTLQADGGQFHAEAQRLFRLCRQAVHDQLGREVPAAHGPHAPTNGHVSSGGGANPAARSGSRTEPNESCDTESPVAIGISERQLAFIQDLANQIQGLGMRRLPVLVALQYDKNLTELSSPEASLLINLLRQVRSGKTPLVGLLEQDSADCDSADWDSADR